MRIQLWLAAAWLSSAAVCAQASPAAPFKLGTFLIDGSPFLGGVLRDNIVVHLNRANADLELDPADPKIPVPADMIDLIARYEDGMKPRLYQLVTHLVRTNKLAAGRRPAYVYDVAEVKTMPPLMDPGKIMNATVNLYSHVKKTGAPEQIAAAQRARRENRSVPYLFQFYGDPMANLHRTLSVDRQQMQEARAGEMIHSLYEPMEYASSLMTLYPGDVLNNGTSGGVSMGAAVRGEQRFLRAGETIEASIDGIGTLRLPVLEEPEPKPGTGARLPPVNTCRRWGDSAS